jgi:hypothetical protein
MKAYTGVDIEIHVFLTLTKYLEVRGQLHAPAALSPGKAHPVSIGKEAGWAPKFAWTKWREEINLSPTGARNPTSSPSKGRMHEIGGHFNLSVCLSISYPRHYWTDMLKFILGISRPYICYTQMTFLSTCTQHCPNVTWIWSETS